MAMAMNGSCELYYEAFGDPADPTLLLVNGLGSQCINYNEAWCAMFAARGLHVVRFDNRDVGMSSKFDDAPTSERGAAYTISDMAADGVAVLDALGVERAHVMGLSMGGMIVQVMAIEHRDRLLSMTSVMSRTGEPGYGDSTPEAFALLDAERAFDRCFHPSGPTRQYRAIEASPPRADALRHVSTPTLVMHGDRDTLIDISGGRRTAELIPGARFEAIGGLGHDYPPQLWEKWVDVVGSFVSSISRPA